MLQLETVPASLAGLLWVFRSCFTAPSFATFGALVVGLVAQSGRRTVCGMLVGLPFAARPVCLPVLARLSRPKAALTKQVIAAQLVTMITAAHPDRAVHVVADAWYAGTAGAARGGTRGRGWPQRASLTSR